MGWREFAGDLVHVAPGPLVSGHNRTHHRMQRFVVMSCGVFAGRRVATAHVTAGHTLAQRNPPSAYFEALFAGVWHGRRGKVGLAKILKMFTLLVHKFSSLNLGLGSFRFASNCSIQGKVVRYAGLSRSPRGMRNRSKMVKSPCATMAMRAAGIAPSRIVVPSFRFKPLMIGSPNPPAPMRAASVAEPMVIIVLVFIPAGMEGDASGRKIFSSRVRGLRASTPAASRICGEMSRKPVAVFLTIGNNPYKKRATTAVTGPIPRKGIGTNSASKASEGIV